jgi:Outer membrane protein beta-barrel domain
MTSGAMVRAAVLGAVAFTASVTAASAQGAGVKFGPTFATFSSDALDFKTRTGVHAGLFFGGNPDGPVGVQAEINWLRKNTETEVSAQKIRVDYIQVPVLLRVNGGGNSAGSFRAFGVVGPAVDFKIADEFDGITLDDGFEGADISLVFGGGIEVARIIVEGRYEKGLRRVNDTFNELTDIKKQAFTILFGIRFR